MSSHPHSRPVRRSMAAAVASAAILGASVAIGVGAAEAVGACPGTQLPAGYTAPTLAAELFWEFEGKISAVDEAGRTMTVNGATFHIPDGQLIKTQSLDQTTGNISLTGLMDPAQPSIVGGATGIALGQAVYSTVPETGQQCVSFEASSVYVEWAENVLVGPLMGVATDGSSINIAGSTVMMNTDPRWPATVIDGAGNEVALSDFAGHEGLLLEAEGYFANGALQATVVATDEILVFPEGSDTVGITTARYKSGELRVGGAVAPVASGKTVTIYPGRVNAAGTGCVSTTAYGTAAVSAVDGSYSARFRNAGSNPGFVCVQSSGGGVRDAAVSNG